jgi:two-component system phosphate regulon response regulator PhoB
MKTHSTAMGARILIVEDEEPLTLLLRYNLEAEGYQVDVAGRGDDAEIRLKEGLPDLVVLDWMLPGISGIELCRRLRARSDTERLPIIMLTARGEESERVRGLATGADDYLVKPFSVPELLARVKALLRRANPGRIVSLLQIGDLELDRDRRRVSRAGRDVHLGPTEFRLLEHLMQSAGRVFSRGQLLDGVWGRDVYIDERTVDVHVGRLRRALNRGGAPDPIRTVRGGGYAFDDRFGDRGSVTATEKSEAGNAARS